MYLSTLNGLRRALSNRCCVSRKETSNRRQFHRRLQVRTFIKTITVISITHIILLVANKGFRDGVEVTPTQPIAVPHLPYLYHPDSLNEVRHIIPSQQTLFSSNFRALHLLFRFLVSLRRFFPIDSSVLSPRPFFTVVAGNAVTYDDQLLIGIIRVPGLDTPERLTGFMVALHQANEEKFIKVSRPDSNQSFTNFTVEVYYYPFCGSAVGLASGVCDFSNTSKAIGLAPFLGNMSRFHAIMFTQFDISAPIIDKAMELGGIPIIDPNTIRDSDFSKPNLFLMDHNIETELTVLVRYMLMSHSCARTGIITEAQQLHYAELVRDSFVIGGYRTPPILVIPAPDPNAVSEMFFGDPFQKCIVFLLSSGAYMALMGAVKSDPRFVPGDVKMFGWSQISTTNMRVDGTSAPFKNLFYPKALPSLTGPNTQLVRDYTRAAARWFAEGKNNTDVERHYLPGEFAITAVTTSGLMWYYRAIYGLSVLAHGFTSYVNGFGNDTLVAEIAAKSNATTENIAIWMRTVEVARETKIWASDYAFFSPFAKCPQYPLPQICFCNIVTRVVNLRSINPVTGGAIPLVERPKLGDVNIAAMPLAAEKCIHKLSVGSYPFRLLLVNDVGVPMDVDEVKIEGKTPTERFLYAMTTYLNNNEPIRPWRLVTQSFSPDFTADDDVGRANSEVSALNKMYKPFMIMGTARTITKSDSLAIFTNANKTFLVDPPLTSREDGWDEKVLQFMPVMADLIHAIVGYYAYSLLHASANPAATHYSSLKSNQGGVFVIASSRTEAELVIKSLHTFQIDYPRSSIVVSSDAAVWRTQLAAWAQSFGNTGDGSDETKGPKPFVVAAAAAIPDIQDPVMISSSQELVDAVFGVVESFGSIHVGIGAAEPIINAVIETRTRAANSSLSIPVGGDIIHASPFSEYWMPSNPITRFIVETLGVDVLNPSTDRPFAMNYLAIGAGLALALGSQGINFKDAADLIYSARTASVADVPLGLFFNDTCDRQTIAGNDVSRTCQCNKAFRQFRLHSLYNRMQGEASVRTSHYMYRMATCGVLYEKLVIPPEDLSWRTYLIIGLVCGTALLALATLGTILYFNSGRNNSNAPKDSTKPFAIAFTDIQASTTLWSRCPAVMSDAVEHHCFLIRRLIKKYSGYEVKTIGDSFMVAFASLESATSFSVKLQQVLHEDNEWTREIDQHYREILEAALLDQMQQQALSNFDELADEVDKKSRQSQRSGTLAPSAQQQLPACPLNAPADDDEYKRLWNGIRVRVGTHFGFGEVRKDQVTLGYDYFGTIVNTAARVEGVGHGGQTLITEAVLNDLPRDFLTQNQIVQMNLGPQSLRGLDEKTVLVQLLPFALADRKFPSLRLDVENVIEEGSESSATLQDGLNMTPEQLAVKFVNEVVNKGRKARGYANSSQNSSLAATHGMVSVANVGAPPSAVDRASILKAQTASVAHIQDLIAQAQQAAQLCSKTSNEDNASEHTLPPPPPSQHYPGLLSGDPNNFEFANGDQNRGAGASTTDPVADANYLSSAPGHQHNPLGGGYLTTQTQLQNNRQQQSDIDAVRELLNYFHFFNSLLSTSAENFRRDTIKQIAKRWHVATNSGSVGHSQTDPTRMRIIMHLCVKSMMMVRTQNKMRRSNSRAGLSGIREENNRSLSADTGYGRRSQGGGGGERSQAGAVVSGTGPVDSSSAFTVNQAPNGRLLNLSIANNQGGVIYRGGDGVDLHSPTLSSRRVQQQYFTPTTAVSAMSVSENNAQYNNLTSSFAKSNVGGGQNVNLMGASNNFGSRPLDFSARQNSQSLSYINLSRNRQISSQIITVGEPTHTPTRKQMFSGLIGVAGQQAANELQVNSTSGNSGVPIPSMVPEYNF